MSRVVFFCIIVKKKADALRMTEQQRREVEEILNGSFQPDLLAQLGGRLVYHAPVEAVDEQELETIFARLLARGYFPRLEKSDGQVRLYVLPDLQERKKSRLWLHGLLFLVTVWTTMATGAMLLGKDWTRFFTHFSDLLVGWKYSFAVLTILSTHEFGHYFAARWHRVRVTLPFYLPLFLPVFNLGTMGAFIKIRSPIPNRRALLDIGVSGPLAGFVMSLLFLIYGYATLPDMAGIIAYVEKIHPWHPQGATVNLVLGKSLLFAFFNDVIGGGRLPMNELYHFPFIFAGWVGLLVTAINLIPIGQLDGGHILYALLGQRARVVGVLAFLGLVALNFYLVLELFSFIWVVWLLLILFLIRFQHPPTLNDYVPLDHTRRVLGWTCLAIFVLCFSPLPVYIQP